MKRTVPQRAMILAAGLGNRLRPLTACVAKPALPLMGRPIIGYALELLRAAGVFEVVVNLHHKRDTLRSVLEDSAAGMKLRLSLEPTILGTAGGLKNAESLLGNETFALMNGDTLTSVDLPALSSEHRKSGAIATLLLRPKRIGTSYTSVQVDDGGRICSLGVGRDDGSDLMFAGVWILEPKVFTLLSGRPLGLESELLPRLIENGDARGVVQNVDWITIDTPARYLESCLAMSRQELFRESWSVAPWNGDGEAGGAFVGPRTVVQPRSQLKGRVVVGASCRVESGAVLEDSVLWDRVRIGEGAVVRGSVIASGVEIRPGQEVENKVVIEAPEDTSPFRSRELRDGCVVSEIRR